MDLSPEPSRKPYRFPVPTGPLFCREDLSIPAALDLAYYALCENIKLNPMVGEPIQLAYIDWKGYTELQSEAVQRIPEKIKSTEETQSSLFR
jgi:hypothetical protein